MHTRNTQIVATIVLQLLNSINNHRKMKEISRGQMKSHFRWEFWAAIVGFGGSVFHLQFCHGLLFSFISLWYTNENSYYPLIASPLQRTFCSPNSTAFTDTAILQFLVLRTVTAPLTLTAFISNFLLPSSYFPQSSPDLQLHSCFCFCNNPFFLTVGVIFLV